jgi:hypothetical protein
MRGLWAISIRRAVLASALGVVMLAVFLVGPSRAVGKATPSTDLEPDLRVVVSGPLGPVHSESEVRLEARVENLGTAVALTTRAVFEIPAGGIVVDESADLCTAVGSTRLVAGQTIARQPWTVTCELGTLMPQSAATLSFLVAGGSPGTHVITARVTSEGDEPETADNRTEHPLYVLPDEPATIPAFHQPGLFKGLNRTRA